MCETTGSKSRGKLPWKKRGGPSILLLAILLLAGGCGEREGTLPEKGELSLSSASSISTPESAPDAPEKPADGPLPGCSLQELGYVVEERQNFGVFYSIDVAYPMDCKPQSAEYGAMMGGKEYYIGPYGADVLKGTFTRIIGMAPFINGALSVDFMYLQAFGKESLALEGANIAVGEQTYTATELADYLVFEDEEIAVFDLFPLAAQMAFPQSLDLFVRDLLGNAPPQPGVEPPPLSPDKEYPDYTFLQEVYDYVRENLPELIHKETAPAASTSG